MARVKYKKIPGKLTASAALICLMGAGAAALLLNQTAQYEGYVEEAYLCPAEAPTICFGNTKNVKMGQKETFEGCLKRLNSEIYEHAAPVFKCVPELKYQPDKVKAAFVSMAYNIGVNGFCKSSVARYANDGNWERACRRISQIYKTAKGKELPGLVKRRNDESRICLEGLSEAKLEF